MWKDTKGVVFVEFLLVFPPLFLLFLLTLQWALLSATDLGVRHAASAAVRSAIVVIPDDPDAYEGDSPPGSIPRETSCTNSAIVRLSKLLDTLGVAENGLPKDNKCLGGPRMQPIQFTAMAKMLPFSPNISSLGLPGLGALSSAGELGWLVGAAGYSYGATAVSFPEEPDSDKLLQTPTFTGSDPVTVRVSYLAYCGIPLARLLMCDKPRSLTSKGIVSQFNDFRQSEDIVERRKSSRPVVTSMREYVGNKTLFSILLAPTSSNRFMVLSADATLPYQGAPYAYQAKSKKKK